MAKVNKLFIKLEERIIDADAQLTLDRSVEIVRGQLAYNLVRKDWEGVLSCIGEIQWNLKLTDVRDRSCWEKVEWEGFEDPNPLYNRAMRALKRLRKEVKKKQQKELLFF